MIGKTLEQTDDLKGRGIDSPRLYLLLLILLAIGVLFRFTNLDKKVYWNDEVLVSLRLSGHTGSEVLEQVFHGHEIGVDDLQRYQRVEPNGHLRDTLISLAREDAKHPPLYYVVGRFWVQILGDSIKATRALSAAISLLVFPCLYWLSRE